MGALMMGLGACAVGPVNGVLLTYTSFAGEYNPANNVVARKSGKSCEHVILGLVGYGTAGAGQIALDTGIQRIATIDHSTLSILNGVIYTSYCTIVWGE